MPHNLPPTQTTGKIDRNIARDAETLMKIEDTGWKVLIVWECQMRNDELLGLTSDFLKGDCNQHFSQG